MKFGIRRPAITLGKVSLVLIVLTFAAWLFVNNAENCLSRDFVEQAPTAICWRATNDYESTIGYSQNVFVTLLALAIICSSMTLSRLKIRHSAASTAENKKTAWLLTFLSCLLLAFILTVAFIWQRTTYSNNNYVLNDTANVAIEFGSPIWLALATSAATYGLHASTRRKS